MTDTELLEELLEEIVILNKSVKAMLWWVMLIGAITGLTFLVSIVLGLLGLF